MATPWVTAGLTIDDVLDQLYAAHSNHKLISPFVYDLIEDNDTPALTAAQKQTLARMIFVKYNDKWTRLWALGEAEYNPLYNNTLTETYTGSETIDTDTTDTGTVSTDRDTTSTGSISKDSDTTSTGTVSIDRDTTDTGTDATQVASTQTNTGTIADNGAGSRNDNIYGFNSSSAVGDTTHSTTDTNTRTNNLTEGLSGTTTETRNLAGTDDSTETRNLAGTEDITETRNLAGTDDSTETRNLAGTEDTDKTKDYTLTRNGMLGTTPQELIEAERTLWDWNIWDTVFKDLDSILTIDVY